MIKKYTQQEWLDIIEQSNKSQLSNKKWCAVNGIHYRSYTSHKYLYKRKGLLEETTTPVEFKRTSKNFYEYYDADSSRTLYFYPKHIKRVSIDLLQALVHRVIKVDTDSNNLFLFLNDKEKTLFVLRWHDYGVSVTKCTVGRRKIPWVNSEGFLSEEHLKQLKKMI